MEGGEEADHLDLYFMRVVSTVGRESDSAVFTSDRSNPKVGSPRTQIKCSDKQINTQLVGTLVTINMRWTDQLQ